MTLDKPFNNEIASGFTPTSAYFRPRMRYVSILFFKKNILWMESGLK
jgi:hypothetical protein